VGPEPPQIALQQQQLQPPPSVSQQYIGYVPQTAGEPRPLLSSSLSRVPMAEMIGAGRSASHHDIFVRDCLCLVCISASFVFQYNFSTIKLPDFKFFDLLYIFQFLVVYISISRFKLK